MRRYEFLEFFAGGGMARAGLGVRWECKLANDFDSKKANTYKANWGSDHFYLGDVQHLPESTLLGAEGTDLAWASFPCQDLSLAGNQIGLAGKRSGAFWGFWQQIVKLQMRDQHPKMLVVENVCGLLTSNGGQDFALLLDTLRDGGYRSGALIIDAVHFVPQSRPRLFLIGVRTDCTVPRKLTLSSPTSLWTPVGLATQMRELDCTNREDWISWRLPLPPARRQTLIDILDDVPSGVEWHSSQETEALIAMMSSTNLEKIRRAQLLGRRAIGTLYKRTRSHSGGRSQRAEVRFDEIAGCLRTPGGGSSRQTVLEVNGKRLRSRLLSPREAARLMGLHESYKLPPTYNEAYKLAGDGVVVPVVRHLAEYLLEPVLAAQASPLARSA